MIMCNHCCRYKTREQEQIKQVVSQRKRVNHRVKFSTETFVHFLINKTPTVVNGKELVFRLCIEIYLEGKILFKLIILNDQAYNFLLKYLMVNFKVGHPLRGTIR